MIFFIGVCALLCAVMYKRYYNCWINPGSVFLSLWGGIMCLYSLRLYSIYAVDMITILVFGLGIISFAIGCIPVSFRIGEISLHKEYSICKPIFGFQLKSRMLFLIASLVAVFILAIRAVNTLPYWSGGVSAVKQANVEGYISYSSWVSILYTFFASPIETLSVFVVAVDLFFDRSIFLKSQIVLTGLMIILGYIASGSKFSLFVPVLAFGVSYFVYRIFAESNIILELSIWKKMLILAIVIVFLAFIIYMLNQKYGGWVESLYLYLVGCIPCGDNAVRSMNNKDFFYGMVSLNGLFRVVSYFVSFFGIAQESSFPLLNEAYNSMMVYEKAINISPSVSYNAFISMFAYFYKDGGLIGVVIFSLVFGRFSQHCYTRLMKEQSAFALLMYIYIIYLILFGIVRCQLYLAPAVMILIYIIVFFKKRS